MRNEYMAELKELNNKMLEMGNMVETSIQRAIKALVNGDVGIARDAVEHDEIINKQQKSIESLCFRLLLTQQPVAADLRMVSSALKMVTDMERIGDHAADISEITIFLAGYEYIKNLDTLKMMAAETTYMVNKSIEAYVNGDTDLANEVIRHDDVVDNLFLKEKKDIVKLISESAENADQATDLLMVAKYFERIGDHATNIAEWAIYSQTGDINIIQ